MTVQHSTLYLKCPGCGDTTLILRDARGTRCAGCGFDYASLAADRPRFEAYLVERMREGPMGQLGAIALAQWLSDLPPAAATLALRELAARNGVALPEPADPRVLVRRILLALAIGILLLLALVAWSVTRS